MDRIRITQPVAEKLLAYHLSVGKSKESLSFAYATAVGTSDGDLVIVLADPDDVLLLAPDCYISNGAAHLSVPADVRAGVVMRGIAKNLKVLVLIDIHDHFFADKAHYSGTDDRDDLRTAIQYKQHLSRYLGEGQSIIAISLLLGRREWAARRVVWSTGGEPVFKYLTVDILGESLHRYGIVNACSEPWSVRQSGLISPQQSAIIKSMRLSIVGGGGTGSIAFETACRLGFAFIDVIDQDRIEVSNLNRFQGASTRDVGEQKAEFLAKRGKGLFPSGNFGAINTDAFTEAATKSLIRSDVIIGCVDNAETRWYLNRLAVQFAIPYFDCGNLIQLEPDVVLHSRINAVIPGLTRCGHCSDIEFMPRKIPDSFVEINTLRAQREAGYVQNQPADIPAPAIYPLNLQTVSWLMGELLNWLCGRTFAHSIYYRSNRNLIERLDRSNYPVGPAEDCPVCSSLLGTCFESRLPRRGGEVCLSNIVPEMEINHG